MFRTRLPVLLAAGVAFGCSEPTASKTAEPVGSLLRASASSTHSRAASSAPQFIVPMIQYLRKCLEAKLREREALGGVNQQESGDPAVRP